MEDVRTDHRGRPPSNRLTALFLAAIVVMGTLAVIPAAGAAPAGDDPALAAADQDEDPTTAPNGTVDEADDVYVTEDGDAILVSEGESNVSEIEMGADVSAGLARLLVVDDLEDVNQSVDGDATVFLEQDALTANGSVLADRPEEVEHLDLQVVGEQTSETNTFQADLQGTFTDSEDGQAVRSAGFSTEGRIVQTADSFETSGTYTTERAYATPGGRTLDVSLADTDSGYRIDVTREEPVRYFADRWNSRENASETLEEQYASAAEEFGGTSSVTITHYSYEERENDADRLELTFTVEYTGIEEGLEDELTNEFAQDPELDVTEDEARAIAENVTAVSVDTFEFSNVAEGRSSTVEWDVRLSNYEGVLLAYLDVVQSSDVHTEAEWLERGDVEDAREMVEARKDADLRTTTEWQADVERTEDRTTEVTAQLSSESTNWDAYVAELERRGVETGGDVTLDVRAYTENDEITVDGSVDVQQEELVNETIAAMRDSLDEEPNSSEDAESFVAALESSDLQIARIDLSVEDGTVTIEASAKADGMEAFVPDDASVSPDKVVVVGDDETRTTYVYVEDVVDDPQNVTRADLSHIDAVSADTTVHAAGTWNRSFPDVDNRAAADHLDVDYDTPTTTTSSPTPGGAPGFGPVAALLTIAALLAALRARRT